MPFNIARINSAIAAAIPERDAVIYRDRRLSFGEVHQRSNRLANFLLSKGITIHRERATLENWESGQDHVGLYMYNCNEFLEAMLGTFKSRSAQFNVNYRYVAEELIYLLRDAHTSAVIYHGAFAAQLAEVLPELPDVRLLIQVDDGSGADLLPGAYEYEAALASVADTTPELDWSDDDVYILYTGGTTGMPKGVLWRQADCTVANLGGRMPDGSVVPSIEAIAERARRSRGLRIMPASPFMHGAGSYVSFNAWHWGNPVVIQDETQRFDPADVLATAEREHAQMLLVIGDAFGRPLLEELKRRDYDLSALQVLMNTGAILSDTVKAGLIERIPQLRITDSLGTSETGPQGSVITDASSSERQSRFRLMPDAAVLSADRTHVLEAGSDELGWLVKRNHVPLGYLGDRDKTLETFPVVNGERYVVGGDRVRLLAGGELEYHGRESFTINSGGEKIFAEEVEIAIKRHPAVTDVVVVGRPSERWGNEVVAIVQRADAHATEQSLLDETGKHVARYKLPKAFVFVDHLQRQPNGKTDYGWALAQALAAA